MGEVMLHWAFIFLIIALIAWVLGFTTVAGVSYGLAKLLFFVFLLIFIVLLALGIFILK